MTLSHDATTFHVDNDARIKCVSESMTAQGEGDMTCQYDEILGKA